MSNILAVSAKLVFTVGVFLSFFHSAAFAATPAQECADKVEVGTLKYLTSQDRASTVWGPISRTAGMAFQRMKKLEGQKKTDSKMTLIPETTVPVDLKGKQFKSTATLEGPVGARKICVTLVNPKDKKFSENWCSPSLKQKQFTDALAMQRSLDLYKSFKTLRDVGACTAADEKTMAAQEKCIDKNGANLRQFLVKHEKISGSCLAQARIEGESQASGGARQLAPKKK